MADFSIKYGLKKDLPAYSAALEGALLITTDERAVYANIGGGQFRIGDFQIVNTLADLPSPESAGTQLFFVKATNALAVSNGTQWIQVNTDTGATGVAFTGGSGTDGAPSLGEVVSNVTYDSETRKMVFTVSKIQAEHVLYKDGTVKTALDNKTDRTLTSVEGKALIFNESDGGGAKFEHADGTNSFVGVNSGGANGITGQLYSVDRNNGNLGTRLNMTSDGFFYTRGKSNATFDAGDELVTKKELTDGATGKTVYLQDESLGQEDYAKVYKLYQGADSSDMTKNTLVGTINIPKDLVVKSGTVESVTVNDQPYIGAKVGDKYIDLVIQNQTNHLYIPANKLVDVYTVEQNAAEVQLSISANNVISATIVSGSISEEKLSPELRSLIANKTDHALTGTNGKALIFNETDGGGAKFEHKDGTWSFVGVNDGGANGITGQIYSVDSTTKEGSRINVTSAGIFYTNGNTNASYTAEDEIATKKDVESAKLTWGTFTA